MFQALRGEKGRGAKVLQTYRPSDDEAGPREAFSPKNLITIMLETVRQNVNTI